MNQTLYPSLAYEDAPAAIDWLHKAFGLVSQLVVPDGDSVIHAELRTPGSALVMVLSTSASTRRNRSPQTLGGTAQSVYVAVPDAAALEEVHSRAQSAGADIFNPMSDKPYGREFCCLDPEGHIWTFGTYAPQAEATTG